MKIAAAYIRVSTDDQIEYSPDSQRKAILDYAKRNDYIVPAEYIFVDEGISGRSTKRPAFQPPLRHHPRLEVQPVRPQPGGQRGLQVHAPEAVRRGCGVHLGADR